MSIGSRDRRQIGISADAIFSGFAQWEEGRKGRILMDSRTMAEGCGLTSDGLIDEMRPRDASK